MINSHLDRLDAAKPARWWRGLVVMVAAALIAASCSSPGGSDTTEGPDDADGQSQLEAAAPTTIVFTNSDGSAFSGSQTIFIVTDVETEESFLVPVFGEGNDTRTEVPVAPGTYRITSSEPHVAQTGSYVVNNVEPAEVTVAADESSAASIATVDFGLDVQLSPFELRLTSVTATSVDLVWESLEGVDAADFELRQIVGSTAASNATEGVTVSLNSSDVGWASAAGLDPDTEYTFTLFASTSSGESLASRSLSVTTASADGDAPAFALAPNTIVATDLAALNPRLVDDLPPGWQRALTNTSYVEIELAGLDRSSASEIPGIDASQLDNGCVVGQPFLLSTEVAGDDAFYGLIAQCSTTTAIVNTDVPLAAVIPFLSIRHTQRGGSCFDANGTDLGPSAELCQRTDTDGDGIADVTERVFRLDPTDANDNWESLDNPATENVSPPVEDLVAPEDLGSGEIQVTLLWSTGDDLDLHVTDPEGNRVFFENTTGVLGGRLDRDDAGDQTCQSAETRAENIFWDADAPRGTYSVDVKNFRVDQGEDPCGVATQARLVVRVDGEVVKDQIITVGAEGPLLFDLAPSGVEVRVTWSTPDDLNLRIDGAATIQTEPGFDGGVSVPMGPPSYGTYIAIQSAGDFDCETINNSTVSSESKYDLVHWDEERLTTGDFSVTVRNAGPCNASVDARLEVWVRGELVLSEVLTVEEDSQVYSFSVAEEPAGFRRPGTTRDAGSAHLLGPSALATRQEGISVECETESGYEFTPGFGWDPFDDVEVDLKWGSLTWDIKAGIEVSLDPKLEFTGNAECALEAEGVSIQLVTQPVPVNLELTPAIDGEVEGTFTLAGPRLELTFGVATEGGVDASVETCFYVPCDIDIDSVATATPFGEFSHHPASVSVEATAQINLGVEANLGIGLKNKFITGKVGFAVTMQPVSVEVTGSASVDATGDAKACAAINVGAKAGVDFVAEAFVLGWGADERFTILEAERFEYPGAGFEIGDCEENPPTTTTVPKTTTTLIPSPTSAPPGAEETPTTALLDDLQRDPQDGFQPEPLERVEVVVYPIRQCPAGYQNKEIPPGAPIGETRCSIAVELNQNIFPTHQDLLSYCQPPVLAAENGDPVAVVRLVKATPGATKFGWCLFSANDEGLPYLGDFALREFLAIVALDD